jgi:hypothetical protein
MEGQAPAILAGQRRNEGHHRFETDGTGDTKQRLERWALATRFVRGDGRLGGAGCLSELHLRQASLAP